ncbi:hypothetical protein EDI_273450 [Entamoeba dispar SAW760]|uniref:Geminivirus AL1 replication-associated protein catalytic domain-containing protein n=1 Tax=Entamoeba dispar (strain ATCC PRA-260 / SAW760) TaxID=370354 RepID=B0EJ06_ENTDS|nr:uncharacterized protein EDI_273450 [Entamoeba dispar SAW760]EDR25487.1 hypothetical protein EDI_273450 [Entamoeba dispar SAW760]|eukprot:EDR25487.1 hypothetical protein EDI_273450 [Entamoeba dispar SAW760]
MSTNQFTVEPSRNDFIHLNEALKTNKPLHFTSRYLYLTLWGDEIKNNIQFKEVVDRMAGATSNVQYAHVSPVEHDDINPRPHQHMLIVLKRPKSFKARPIITHADGTKQTFWYSRVNSYTSRTGDISALVKYITKKGKGIFQGDPDKKEELKQTWINALNDMDSYRDYKELEQNLMEINAEKYIQQEGRIKARWMRKNARRIDMEQYTKTDLLPWREDMEEIKTIRKWIKCASGDRYRMGNLFIVGSTKTGKTEFAVQEIFMKYNTFMLRGDSLFDTYDDEQHYKFILFDDINYDKNTIRLIKAITSTINKKTVVNIKYSKAIVTARPCIHLLNQKEYENVVNLMRENGGYSWWRRNSLTVFLDKKIYKDPQESENSSENMQEQETNYDPQKDLEEKYNALEEKDEDTTIQEEYAPEHVSFYNRVTSLLEELGYDDDFLSNLDEKIKEKKKNNPRLEKTLRESQQDNESMQEEWNNDLEEYQSSNPLGIPKEDFKDFEKETMSSYEKQRNSYFARHMDSSSDDYDDDEDYEDEEMNNPMEHRPFGGKDNDMDIIYD